MSVKTMLPLLGVGSAFAVLGLVASRRSAKPTFDGTPAPGERRMPSGVHPRVSLDDADAAPAAAPELTSDFWDASPESYSLDDLRARPASELESYDAIDPEDLSAEWLTRATEAPAGAERGMFDLDDPAEIPADSISMISDASRHAALDLERLDESSVDLDLLEADIAGESSDRAADSRI
jgi:hypothetical protein